MESVAATVIDLYRAVHAKMREEVRGMEADALNWAPVAETNSVAALVVHTLGSEAEVLRTVRNVQGDRDRDAEFLVQAPDAADLVRRLDEADALLADLGGGITADDLVTKRHRGERDPETGLYWLVSNYGHAREHLAHLQLTKQLHEARGTEPS